VERVANAWRLAKASWHVLSQDRELVAVPIVATIASLLVFGVIAVPGFLLVGGNDSGAGDIAVWIIFVIASVAATWMSAIGQAAVVAAAAQRMDGRDPTLGSAFAVARGRAVRLLEWAVLATVVSIVLDQIEERFGALGRMVSWLAGVTFRVLSFLALPVIVFEDVGAVEGFKRSSSLLRSTWGEQVTFSFGMGLLGFVAALPALVVGGALLGTGILALQVIGVVAAVVWSVAVLAVTSVLSGVFKTALYRHAKGLPVDPGFRPRDLDGAFRRRRRSGLV
jgi:hypothetical protein